MTIGFYQHGGMMDAKTAKALRGLGGSARVRNARYFNDRELEKFEMVVVDEGKNTTAITDAYTKAGVKVKALSEFLKTEKVTKQPKPEEVAEEQAQETPAGENPEFNPDKPRKGGRKPRKQG